MRRSKTRVALGVTAFWLLIAFVSASQTVIAGALKATPVAMGEALTTAIVQTVSRIPITLVVIALVTRWPVGRDSWRRRLPLHVLAFAALLCLENSLVVLGYWISTGSFGTLNALAHEAVKWIVLRAHVGAAVYAAIGALTQGATYNRAQRERELRLARIESQLATARLDALVARMRPHFLFNTLHTIGHLWRSGRHTDADAMLDHLGDLFHRVHRSTSSTLVPLDEELDMVEAYLAIEQARFADRLRVEIQADDDARAVRVPPLLLQPLVENAIRHGVAARSTAGHVAVRAWRTDGRLDIIVEDDGPGLNDEATAHGTGTGLSATRERLVQLFGEAQSLVLEHRPGGGTLVRLELPAGGARSDNGGVAEFARAHV